MQRTALAMARGAAQADPMRRAYDAAGAFLATHRLDYDPARYAFAWQVVTKPDGPLATAVRSLTDGGVRLTERDLEVLGEVGDSDRRALARAMRMVADAHETVAGFSGLVDRMRAEATDFGRDLAATAAQVDPVASPALARLAGDMITRTRDAEGRLQQATIEAAALRVALAEAREDAREDPLTGLCNRRGLIEAFEERARQGQAMCLAIYDVDHFKRINDGYGHAVGDRVLGAIARSLSDACGGALVARYGGEEFAVLIDGDDLAAATAMIDRARALIAGKRYRLRDLDTILGTITLSAGVVALAPGDPFDAGFARADALLYQAKHAGRNRVLS